MNNWDYYTLLNYFVTKYPTGNALNSSEYEDLFNYAQMQYLKKRLGLPEDYQPMQPVTRDGYGVTEKNIIDLEPFVVTYGGIGSTPFKFTNGTASIPSNLYHFIGMNKKVKDDSCDNGYYFQNVELLSRAEFNMRKSSVLLKPSDTYPVVTAYGGKFEISPKEVVYVNFDYIKIPDDIVVSTTINATTGEEEYSATTSVESEWSISCNYDILAIIMGKVGINIRSQEIQQAAMLMEQKGS